MEAVLEGGDDTEVAAPAPQRPEQIVVLLLAGDDDLAVGGDHLGRLQVVARQPVLAGQVPDAAAQREAGDPRRADDAARRRQTIHVGRLVEHLPRATPAGARRPGVLVDGHRLQRAEIDDDAAVVGAETGRAVGATANAQVKTFSAGEGDDRSHVARARAAHDRRRSLVDHPVMDLAGLFVAAVPRSDHLALDLLA